RRRPTCRSRRPFAQGDVVGLLSSDPLRRRARRASHQQTTMLYVGTGAGQIFAGTFHGRPGRRPYQPLSSVGPRSKPFANQSLLNVAAAETRVFAQTFRAVRLLDTVIE